MLTEVTSLSTYFKKFRENIIGANQMFETPFGIKKMVYADWTASGRLYAPIEDALKNQFAPFIGNTHTETNVTGTSMTLAYHYAQSIIKEHVNASEKDVIIMTGSGMTGAVNKFQRILGFKNSRKIGLEVYRPIVFVTHLEHHSNEISWRETAADVEVIQLCPNGNVDLNHLESLIKKYQHRKYKIAAICGCSNVTGIQTPYHDIAEIMHTNGGVCFVDFACSAPYIEIDMHPENPLRRLDAVYFSMHKFLGGPGTPGVLIFNKELYNNAVPDNPGGGTVTYVNPWGLTNYINPETSSGIEAREDGGTPPFYQTIKSALCVNVKENMGVENMMQREEELLHIIFNRLSSIDNLHILAPDNRERLGVVSFFIEGLHYNLGVKMLNDFFGIQVRGGCACAGPYGHCLLNIDQQKSLSIANAIQSGDYMQKPGWIRLSIHPVMSDKEVHFIIDAIEEMALSHQKWSSYYQYQPSTNEFFNIETNESITQYNKIKSWFEL